MAEDMMNEEMTGMAAPAPEAPMPAEEPMPQEPTEAPKYDMETMMGNFMDMPQERRKIATRLLASPAVELFDEILGEPAMADLREQLGKTIEMEPPEAPAAEGMMAPTEEPMAEAPEEPMPMEDEEATPPV